MVDANSTCDVFISYAARDAALAEEIAAACRMEGLQAFTHVESSPREDSGDVLREALAESRAVLVVISSAGPTPNMAIELGAARAWNKPIFAVVTDPAATHLLLGLAGVSLYPQARIDDVVRAIKQSAQQLTDEDRALLIRLYRAGSASVDQLAVHPQELTALVGRFRARSGKAVAGERLLSELLRMRKQGMLSKRHRRTPPRRRTEPA